MPTNGLLSKHLTLSWCLLIWERNFNSQFQKAKITFDIDKLELLKQIHMLKNRIHDKNWKMGHSLPILVRWMASQERHCRFCILISLSIFKLRSIILTVIFNSLNTLEFGIIIWKYTSGSAKHKKCLHGQFLPHTLLSDKHHYYFLTIKNCICFVLLWTVNNDKPRVLLYSKLESSIHSH